MNRVPNANPGLPLLRMDRMVLENFRNISRLEISFDPNLTVIVARNGCGKTAVLDAMAVALGPFIGAFDAAKGVHFRASDVRRIPNPDRAIKESEPQYPLLQQAEGYIDGQPQKWSRALNNAESRTTYGEAAGLVKYGKQVQKAVRDLAAGKAPDLVLPIVSYYGTGRLWSEKRLTVGRKASSETSRTAGYTDCLDSASHYKMFVSWFERLCRAEYEERDNPRALSEITARLSAVRHAVDSVLQPSGWRGIAFKSADAGVIAEHVRHGQMSVDWLSDGIRNMIALAADIAHRAVRLNSHLGAKAVEETPGIVLIDEVDMHLHPEWQQTVVASLRQAFPRIQFIVTTHSPQVLTTIRSKNIRMLQIDEQGCGTANIPTFNTYAEESRVPLEDVMDTPSRPPLEIAGMLKKYQQMVELGHYHTEDARQLRQKLEAEYGLDHVELRMADMDIRTWEAVKKAEGK